MATIEITKAEAKEAGVFKSEMYENLKEAREATGYKVVVKDTKRKADTMKGLTYAYMTIYIEKKAGDRKEALMTEFNELRGCVNGKRDMLAEKATYGEVKAWFLKQFTEITEFNCIIIKNVNYISYKHQKCRNKPKNFIYCHCFFF